jgi:hypothetical protein
LTDPQAGDFRPLPGSPAEGYGCRTFAETPIHIWSDRPAQQQKTPTLTTLASPHRGSIDVSGLINEDTSWQADTVRVVGDVEISDQVTLQIGEGVRVEFQGHFALAVQGRLLAVGTPSSPVVFTSANSENFQIDSTLTGAWNGIRFEQTPATNDESLLEYCIIEYAKAVRDTALAGSLILENYSGLRVVNSVIRHNAGDHGAALFCLHSASPRLINCLIHDNHAFTGGAVLFTLDSYPRLVGCTIAKNHDINPDIFVEAAAILSYMSKPQITSSILWGNDTNYFIPAQLWEGKGFYTTWSDIDGNYPGTGNFNADPDFVGSGSHPYSLDSTSPCVNRGAPEIGGLDLPLYDLAGNPRLTAGRLDTGAYEYNPLTVVVDGDDMTSRLLSNSPNPFNPTTTFTFSIDHRQAAVLTVFDVSGRQVAVVAEGVFTPGTHRVEWNGADMTGRSIPSGIYLVQLRTRDMVTSRKITLLR